MMTLNPGCDRQGGQPTGPASPAPTASDPAWFEDSTEASGLNFVHDPGFTGKLFMPETVGSGCAFIDYDNDGLPDIYLITNGGENSRSTNKLYHNDGHGHFTDVTARSGLGISGRGMGVAVGDFNNDGYPDLLVTEFGRVRLFINHGDGTFSDVTRQAGIDDRQWATSAAFFDYDRDGWLDLVVTNYVDYLPDKQCFDQAGAPEYCGPTAFTGTVTKLFHNSGKLVDGVPQFQDVTVASGLAAAPGAGLGVTCADLTGDGWPDILVTNDAQPNHLWVNQHDGTFKEEAVQRGIAYNSMGVAQANMGIAIADTTENGLCDIYVTHLTEESNILWAQGPPGLFRDRTAEMGLAGAAWRGTGFGDVFADFDNRGAVALAVANGRVRRENRPGAGQKLVPGLDAHWSAYAERNQLFANDGSGHFHDVSARNPAFCETPRVGRGLAWADIDNDGGVDLLVTNIASAARLYHNIAPNRGHWLLVRLVEPAQGGRDAYGAKVVLDSGGARRTGWVNPGSSYLSSSDPRVHFGLGKAPSFDAVHVTWPEGAQEAFPGGAADRVLVLKRGEGRAESGAAQP